MPSFAEFKASLTDEAPPEGLSLAVTGLWWDATWRRR